jgi:hypothetical protein
VVRLVQLCPPTPATTETGNAGIGSMNVQSRGSGLKRHSCSGCDNDPATDIFIVLRANICCVQEVINCLYSTIQSIKKSMA